MQNQIFCVSYENSNVLCRIKITCEVFFLSARQSNSWTLKYLSYMKKKKEKYIPLTLNTWTEVGYKTKAFMSYSIQSWASWIVIWLLLLVITSLWAPLLELFLQLHGATMRIRRLTIATASLTHESTCSSPYITKRSMKLYQIFNTEKKKNIYIYIFFKEHNA